MGSPEHETIAARFDDAFRAQLRELFVWRRDVRRFKRDALPPGTLERLIGLACLAPSVGLSQPWRFVSVTDEARRRAVKASFERCNRDALVQQTGDRASLYARLKLQGLDEAPCQFGLFADRSTARGHGLGRLTMPQTIEYSTVLALHTLWLAARAEGFGLGWVSILDPDTVSAALDVPDGWTFVGYFCLGYPAEENTVPELALAGWETPIDASSLILSR